MIVGVVGAGTMGAGIAQVCLQAGHEVLLHDVDEQAIERGRSRIVAGLQRLVAKGSLDAGDATAALERLRDAHGIDGLGAEADVVIEAALEDLELKRTIFRALGQATRADALLATNTSALSVSAIADATLRPERVVGLHFFNPAPVMRLVEVVTGEATAQRTVDDAIAFTEALGKEPVVCRDAPGFIVNRVNRPFTLEALRLVFDERLASIEDVDRAIEEAGYPMGPFRLMDLVGIDINLAVAQALYRAFDEAPRFRPSEVQATLVDAGSLGRKTGMGFYRYGADGAIEGPNVASADPAADGRLTPTDIVGRLELAIINEAYHAVGEEVAEPPDIDRAMKLGAAHPYGPFERAGQLGLRAVVEGLQTLARTVGVDGEHRFAPAPALWTIAHL